MTLLNPEFWKWVCFFLWLAGTATVIIAQILRRTDIRAEKMNFNDPIHTIMRATIYVWLTMWIFVAMG